MMSLEEFKFTLLLDCYIVKHPVVVLQIIRLHAYLVVVLQIIRVGSV